MRSILVGLAVAAMVVAGCGGDGNGGGEEDTPARTVESFYAAAADGDADAACKEITKNAEPDLQFLLQYLFVANQPCKEAVRTAYEEEGVREMLSEAEIEVTEESGDKATVEVVNPDESPVPLKVEVIREGDDWKINDQNIGSANP